MNFLKRQTLLQILYGSVPDKRKILVGKRVSEIDYSHDGVVVHCKDGTLYSGSVVVGADGVHSMVRQEMWRHMELESPGAVSHEEKHSEPTSRGLRIALTFQRNDRRVQLYVWRIEASQGPVSGHPVQDLRGRCVIFDRGRKARPGFLVHFPEAGPEIHHSQYPAIHERGCTGSSVEALGSIDHWSSRLPGYLGEERILPAGTTGRSVLH